MKVIYAGESLDNLERSVFLAGPTPRDGSVGWRPSALDLFEHVGFDGTVLVPEPVGGWEVGVDYSHQIDWEYEAMEKADIVMFWIPREMKKMPAMTTNFEFGYWIAKDPTKMRVGWPSYAEKMRYFEHKTEKYGIEVFPMLKSLITNVRSSLSGSVSVVDWSYTCITCGKTSYGECGGDDIRCKHCGGDPTILTTEFHYKTSRKNNRISEN